MAYSFRIVWHARQAAYQPDWADWFWYIVFPLIGHLALVGAAVLLWRNVAWSLALIAANALAFLFLGVHNSWDTVTFIAIQHGQQAGAEEAKDPVDPALR